MKQLTIKKQSFTEWFFKSGSDQEQEWELENMGRRVMESLYDDENDSVTITIQELFDEVNTDIIPMKFTEEFMDIENDDEIGKVFPEYELKLI